MLSVQAMDTNDVSPPLPSSREIELETALRQRDAQVLSLSDEVARLRYYLTKQVAPSSTEAVPLPPALVSMLLPHIDAASGHVFGAGINGSGTSTTITAALTARAKLLQEENDELYDLLKHDETGRLKEEVRALRRVVDRLESALRDSHNVIMNLSSELDKSYESFYNNNNNNARDRHHSNYRHTQSPPIQRAPLPSTNAGSANGTTNSANKPPPTGPKALKRPRLSAANPVMVTEDASVVGSNSSGNNRNNNNSGTGARGSVPSSRSHEVRSTGTGDSGGGGGGGGGGGTSMDVDDDAHGSTSSRDTRTHHRPHYPSSSQQQRHLDRDRDRNRERNRGRDERERERERDRESDRDRDHDRGSRDRDWDRSAARERERERDRGDEREYERDREKQRERDRGNRNRDRGNDSGRADRQHHDREREREKEGSGDGGGGGRSSRNGRHNSRRRRGPVGGGNLQDLGDRTLAERMGLKS